MRADLKRLKREIDSGKSSAMHAATPTAAGEEVASSPVVPSGPAAAATTLPPTSASSAVVATPASGSIPSVVTGQSGRPKRWYALTAVVAAAALAVGGFLYTRRARALTEKDSIILSDFVNTTGDAVFDGTLKQALAVQLEQSPFLNVFPEGHVRDTLRFMGRSPDERITPDLARQICQREGVKAVLNGSITTMGSQYVVGVDAVNCQTGDNLAREQVQVAQKELVLGAVGKAASNLRGKLGESLASIQKFDAPVEEATTSSLEALKAFSLGEAERAKGSEYTSIPFYKHAVEIDPNFAIAYARLGQACRNSGQDEVGVDYMKKAFERRDRASEVEKLYISTHYYEVVTGEPDKAIEEYQLWHRTYPRDDISTNNLAVDLAGMGKFDQALQYAQETVRLAPNDSHSYGSLGGAYLGLNRFAEAKAVRQRQVELKIDGIFDHSDLYFLAFLEGDTAEMQRQADWAKGRPDEFSMLEDIAAGMAYSGKLQRARENYGQAIELTKKAKLDEVAAHISAQQAVSEALLGNTAIARDRALAALAIERSRYSLIFSGVALALARDLRQATAIADELRKRFPTDTYINAIWLPSIRGQIEIERGNPAKSIELLQAASPYEFGWVALDLPNYVRGQAFLRLKQGTQAATEFQKILDHRGICRLSPSCSLSHLQLGRARALSGDTAGARTAYQDFFAIWKDADPDIPVLKEAKAEYAKIQ
jgi:tetratricopeptide (TPR) repeat protein